MNLDNVVRLMAAGKLPADSPKVNYMGPKKAPFKCSNCKHYLGDKMPCEKVSDTIEAEGCCNLFDN